MTTLFVLLTLLMGYDVAVGAQYLLELASRIGSLLAGVMAVL